MNEFIRISTHGNACFSAHISEYKHDNKPHEQWIEACIQLCDGNSNVRLDFDMFGGEDLDKMKKELDSLTAVADAISMFTTKMKQML